MTCQIACRRPRVTSSDGHGHCAPSLCRKRKYRFVPEFALVTPVVIFGDDPCTIKSTHIKSLTELSDTIRVFPVIIKNFGMYHRIFHSQVFCEPNARCWCNHCCSTVGVVGTVGVCIKNIAHVRWTRGSLSCGIHVIFEASLAFEFEKNFGNTPLLEIRWFVWPGFVGLRLQTPFQVNVMMITCTWNGG